jgi:hypothetical protein
MRKLKLYALSLALFGALGLAALTAAELWIRRSSLAESPEPRDHVEPTRYLPARFRPHYEGQFWGVPFRTNNFGFRDEPNLAPHRPPGELWVLSLGDSIAFGLGVRAEEHYTKVAESLLAVRRESRPPIRILNAGGQGYSPSGYFVYLRHEGLRLSPSLVIVQIELCNDVSDEALLRWRREGDEPYPTAVVGGRYQVGWDGNLLGTYSRGSRLPERTYLYTVMVRRVLNLLDRFRPPEMGDNRIHYSLGFDRRLLTEERLEEGWGRLFGALEATFHLLEGEAIPFLLLIAPSRYLYEETSGYSEPARRALSRAVAWADKRGISYLDLTQTIGEAGGERLFFDFAHLTAEGNRVVGEVLAGYLSARFPDDRSAFSGASRGFAGATAAARFPVAGDGEDRGDPPIAPPSRSDGTSESAPR